MKTRQQDKSQHAAAVDQGRDTVMKETDQVKTAQYHCLLQQEHFSNRSGIVLWRFPKYSSQKIQKYVHKVNVQIVSLCL